MKLVKKRTGQNLRASSPAPVTKPQLDFEDLQRSFVLLSNFRSGSHMFKLSLGKLSGIFSSAEPFNYSVNHETNYTFRNFLSEPDRDVVATFADSSRTMYDFLAYYYNHCPDSNNILIDLKYSQSYALGVDENTMAPVILSEVAKLKLPIVHLVRKDTVAQAVSLLVSEKTGIFIETKKNSEVTKGTGQKFWLDPNEVLRVAKSGQFAVEQASRNMDILGIKPLVVFYEDLVSPRAADSYRRALRFLNHYSDIPQDFEPPTVKQNSSARVANMDEILNYISQSDPSLVGTMNL